MSYTTELLDRFKKTKGIESDYAAAKALDVSQPTISNYRRDVSHADDRVAVILADALELDRFETIARINYERTKGEERAFWRKVAGIAACLAIALTHNANAAQVKKVNFEFDNNLTRYAFTQIRMLNGSQLNVERRKHAGWSQSAVVLQSGIRQWLFTIKQLRNIECGKRCT